MSLVKYLFNIWLQSLFGSCKDISFFQHIWIIQSAVPTNQIFDCDTDFNITNFWWLQTLFFTELVYDHVGFTVLQIQGSLETHVADACAVMWPQPSTKMHQLRYILYAEYSCFRFIATPFEFQVTLEPSWGHNSKMKKKTALRLPFLLLFHYITLWHNWRKIHQLQFFLAYFDFWEVKLANNNDDFIH